MCRLLLVFGLISFGMLLSACQKSDAPEQEVILVRIPPFYDPKLTDGENQCHFSEFLFPMASGGNATEFCKNAPLANDDSLLQVSLHSDGLLVLNSETNGDLSNTKVLKDRLVGLFKNREEMGVFEPGNWKVVKAVGIKIPKTATYDDAIKVIRAVNEGGADPIVLLLDGHLPEIQMESPTKEK